MPDEFSLTVRGRKYEIPSGGTAALGDALQHGLVLSAEKLSVELRRYLQQIVVDLARRHGGAWPGGATGASLATRSGALIRSLQDGVRVAGASLASLQGSITGVQYVTLLEHGGTLSPRSGRYLAIPLPAALKPDGTPKLASPRDWANTFVGKSKAGNLLIFQRQLSELIPLYVLKASVTIRPRLGAMQAIQSQLPWFVSRAMDSIVQGLKA